MAIESHACITITCDGGCENGGYEEAPYHFDSRDAAVDWCRANDWVITDTRQLCPDCSRKADCTATGHQWSGDWLDHERAGVRWSTRCCEHCYADDWNPPREQVWVQLKAADIIGQVT